MFQADIKQKPYQCYCEKNCTLRDLLTRHTRQGHSLFSNDGTTNIIQRNTAIRTHPLTVRSSMTSEHSPGKLRIHPLPRRKHHTCYARIGRCSLSKRPFQMYKALLIFLHS